MGKKYAFAEEYVEAAPDLEGLEHGGQGVVVDGNILTGGVCPHAARMLELEDTTTPLTTALIARLSGQGR